jgi:arabinogalactan oligomer / maltooligosaccharide transport system permease protein
VSTSAVTTPAPSRFSAVSSAAKSLPTRAIAFFSGPVGFGVKIALLAIVNAIAVWALFVLFDHHKWAAAGVLIAATLFIDAVYLGERRWIPAKFLIPGTIFLVAFQIIPIIYTVDVAFTNYSTGHILTKPQAIEQIRQTSLAPADNGKTYTMAPATDTSGNLVVILVDQDTNKPYVGTEEGLKPLSQSAVKLDSDGAIVSATGYTIPQGKARLGLLDQLNTFTVPAGEATIQPQGLDSAVVVKPTLRYDAAKDEFVRISDGTVYRDNGRGSFVSASGDEIEPGWKTVVGVHNFGRMINDPLVRKPFVRVFVWTFVFAGMTVLLSFALGLFLAITLNKPRMRGLRFYRTIFVIPYAIPGFLSLLVWQGLLNDDFGVVNRSILHTHVPWLFDPNMARVSVILVSTWLTFPYFFLVSLGALQSIPAELTEAARVDGAGAWQNFRKVTLPLLLIAVAPLLIASFAFNFNNFGNVYLLTGGGPNTGSSVAGATDILISYTYKLAFVSGKGSDYGLASAVSILIFFIVAAISIISFSKTKALENLA